MSADEPMCKAIPFAVALKGSREKRDLDILKHQERVGERAQRVGAHAFACLSLSLTPGTRWSPESCLGVAPKQANKT